MHKKCNNMVGLTHKMASFINHLDVCKRFCKPNNYYRYLLITHSPDDDREKVEDAVVLLSCLL